MADILQAGGFKRAWLICTGVNILFPNLFLLTVRTTAVYDIIPNNDRWNYVHEYHASTWLLYTLISSNFQSYITIGHMRFGRSVQDHTVILELPSTWARFFSIHFKTGVTPKTSVKMFVLRSWLKELSLILLKFEHKYLPIS